jgi:hypothetical protein
MHIAMLLGLRSGATAYSVITPIARHPVGQNMVNPAPSIALARTLQPLIEQLADPLGRRRLPVR